MKVGDREIQEYKEQQLDDAIEGLLAKGLIERVGGTDDNPAYAATIFRQEEKSSDES